jgi:sugar phosphate isomerase/epimerase
MITRREWIAGCGVMAASGQDRHIPVYAHIWLYAARMPDRNPAPEIASILRDLRGSGVDGVEVMNQVIFTDESFRKLPELSKETELPITGSSWNANTWKAEEHDQILKDGRLLVDRLASLKARNLGMSVGNAGRRKTESEFDAQAAVLRKLIRMASDNGVQLNLHNHVYEVADGEYDLGNTLKRVPEAKLGPDIGWLVRAGVDPLDFIRRHSSRLVYFHIRNELPGGKWPEDLTEGIIDYAAVGRLLREIRFSGEVAIELAHENGFSPKRSNGENFARSRKWLKEKAGL